MQNPAQTADLAGRGYSGSASSAVQQKWLDVAWRQLRRDLRSLGVDLEASITDEDIAQEDVVDVVVSATLRVLRNPDGAESLSAGIDDYTEAVKFSDASQDVYFTAAELRGLTPAAADAGGWVGSVKYL